VPGTERRSGAPLRPVREGEDLVDRMAVGQEVGPDQFPDEVEEEPAIQTGELGDLRLAVVAHPESVGHRDEEEVEHAGLGREPGQVPFPDQPAVQPGEPHPPGPGQPPDPVGPDGAVSVLQASWCSRSPLDHCPISSSEG
jgi:hypothetical protein